MLLPVCGVVVRIMCVMLPLYVVRLMSVRCL